jgi:hypothetical protein
MSGDESIPAQADRIIDSYLHRVPLSWVIEQLKSNLGPVRRRKAGQVRRDGLKQLHSWVLGER